MKRFISFLVALLLLATCSASGIFSFFVRAETQLTDEEILAQRRDIAEAYMRKMTSVIWRAEEDLVYTTASGDYAHHHQRTDRSFPGSSPYEAYQTSVLEFFRVWVNRGLSTWEFTNIK